MAAWTDSEFGQATFTASSFNTESSINSGSTWADSTAAQPLRAVVIPSFRIRSRTAVASAG